MAVDRRPKLDDLAVALASGAATSRGLVEACLERIADADADGALTFIAVDAEDARRAADRIDRDRAQGRAMPRYAGIPISIKDLFDITGQTTGAGSRVLADQPPAPTDAPSVARLRAAGFVLIGRTNMSEFAFSGLGLNPHYGAPRNPWRRAEGHVPGGSSSGAAVSVAEGMAHAALGTDTGGSCRIPAAFTGLVGFKPTAERVPREGCVPLSPTLDSIGPIARSVSCCAIVDAYLAGGSAAVRRAVDPAALCFALPSNYLIEDMDAAVAAAFHRALANLRAAGVTLVELPLPALDRIAEINAKGGFPAAEAYDWHRELIGRAGERYDPRVLQRIRRGAQQTSQDRDELRVARRRLIEEVDAELARFDGLLFPTVPILPPRMADLVDDVEFTRLNLLVLRNSTAINMIDGCAVSLPVTGPDEAPAGLTLAGLHGADDHVLSCAAAIERLAVGETRAAEAS